jgi:hypothetical protein
MSTEVTQQPANSAELADLIESLTVFDWVDGADGYEKSADAMWQAALAAFEYVARKVGATGFQASWSALRFYGEAMNVRGPFMVVKIEDALYPQYDLPGRLAAYIEENRGWLREQAVEKLAGIERDSLVHPNVEAHWRRLAEAAS